jgi:virginiamycin B lyase
VRPTRLRRLLIMATIGVPVLGMGSAADAQTPVEFPLPNTSSNPQGIAAGADGALWFVENTGTGVIGRIATDGSINEFQLNLSLPFGVVPGLNGIAAGPDGALWFTITGTNQIGRITTSGTVSAFPIPSSSAQPSAITAGPDGALWFTETNHLKVGRVTTSGSVTEFPVPCCGGEGDRITVGSDGNLWFTQPTASDIVRLTTAGAVTSFVDPGNVVRQSLRLGITRPLAVGSTPQEITAAADGALWFADFSAQIRRISTTGAITGFNLPTDSDGSVIVPTGITMGPDGALWFTTSTGGQVGRMTLTGNTTIFLIPGLEPIINEIVTGPDGALWFTDEGNNAIGRVPAATNDSPLVAAVLPASRSVQVGHAATAFATIINSGSASASGCAIAPFPVAASFDYQTTNPATNALTGTVNTPVTISAGAAQSFVIAFTPAAPFVPSNLTLGFDCANTDAASSVPGLNTLLLSASASPVPDIVALAASGDPGIVDVPGATGAGVFAVATVNVGATATITASADTGSATLPLTLTVCQTVPATGACMAAPSASVTTTINANSTPTFGIFAQGGGAVAFDPANNRVFVRFTDSGNITRGSTSVAVRTQ